MPEGNQQELEQVIVDLLDRFFEDLDGRIRDRWSDEQVQTALRNVELPDEWQDWVEVEHA